YPPLGSHPEVLPALLEALPEHPQLISHALGRCGDRRATEPLLKLLKGLGSEEIDIRRKVLRALGELGDPRAIPILIQEMQSSEERIRGMAQSALCKIGAPAADAVIDFLDHPDPELRQAALWMLAGIGVPSGAEQRVFACLDDINPEVQSWAAWTMFHMDPDAAAPVLLDHLASAPKSADEPYQKQRTSLAQSLAYLGDPRAIDPLTAILTDPDEDKSVRGFAVRGLISLEAPGLEEVLAEILTDPGQPKGLQIDAIRKLHLLPGDPGTLLLKVLKNIPDPEVGRMAAYQLGRLKDRRAVQPLMEAVRTHRNAEEHSKEEWLVKAAIHALGEIGDSTATPVLMDVLTNATDTNKRVIGDKAASALGKIRDPRTRETLSRLLQKEEQGTWQYSVLGLALGAAGDPAAIPILKQRLKHRGHGDGLSPKGPHYHHTEDAAQVLARFGEAGFMVLMEALDWRHGHTADYACLALAEMHDARALEPIAKLLQHRYYRTRHHAAIALGILGEPDALPYLRKAVKDPDAYVRVGAAEALWRLGDKEYLSVIGDALQNAPGACAEAAHALARIADPRARSLLHDAAKNKDFRIHRPAKEALVALARSEAVQPEQPDE
ncbi:MAG: hypothetical protein GTN65_12565, partial [Armatimonadetes bacterium]|nr:hypothetical protein [Armatimonadota bacterium]NIO97891.1 hypothetical protein [Armatimonadota bacterium]